MIADTLFYKTYFLMILTLGVLIGEKMIDIKTMIAAFISIFIGFLLKVGRDWDADNMSFKKFVLQLIFSFGVGYFGFVYCISNGWDGMYKQLFFGFISFVSGEIITVIESVGRSGIRKYIQSKFDTFTKKDNV